MRISSVIRNRLGWCFQKGGIQQQAVVPTHEQVIHHTEGKKTRLDSVWYREFRIQMLVLGVIASTYVMWVSSIVGKSEILSVLAGMIIAIPLAGLSILHYRDFFSSLLRKSTESEWSWFKERGRTIVCLEFGSFAMVIVILFCFTSGMIPGYSNLAGFVPALVMTYMAIFLVYIFLWERAAGFRIYMKWPVYYCRKVQA
ncbi:MAG: hypothetical protein LUQ50_12435 [Methanospirillum sp.]|uniref:hypothetical protein n=1 Tax=Methanospirillum sp. TaxID=45200 RepID=UPI0023710A0D|nr:hypothetical protein [Methanospirillum sp.]MDD1729865.1 hypothetical protein [Methanospirillum sp.]